MKHSNINSSFACCFMYVLHVSKIVSETLSMAECAGIFFILKNSQKPKSIPSPQTIKPNDNISAPEREKPKILKTALKCGMFKSISEAKPADVVARSKASEVINNLRFLKQNILFSFAYDRNLF